jgi:hypothetical protein
LFISLVAIEEALVTSLLEGNTNMDFTREHMPHLMTGLSSVVLRREMCIDKMLWRHTYCGKHVMLVMKCKYEVKKIT